MIVTIKDLRWLGLCSGQCRKQFVEKGLSWDDFLKNGIEESVLREHFHDNAIVIESLERLHGRG
jgi:hypothetical protein